MSNEELVKQIQKGINQTDNMEMLYTQNRGFIYKIAKRYAFNQDDIDDLLQEAYFGLYEAVKRYEDTGAALFITYASFWIKQAIVRHLEDTGRVVRLSNDMHYKIIRFKKLISAYEMQLGRKPLDKELRGHLEVSQEALERIKKAYHEFYSVGSLDEFVPGLDEDVCLGDTVADPGIDVENGVIDMMMDNSIKTELWQIVEDNVTPEQNTVITARYRKNMTLEATGELIGKSRDMARNLEGQALRKLRLRRITRLIEEKFEVNYAKAYRGSVSSFKNTGTSITEYIALCNLELQGIK